MDGLQERMLAIEIRAAEYAVHYLQSQGEKDRGPPGCRTKGGIMMFQQHGVGESDMTMGGVLVVDNVPTLLSPAAILRAYVSAGGSRMSNLAQAL